MAEEAIVPKDWNITLNVVRDGNICFEGATAVNKMARELGDLVNWLGRENLFPEGCFFLTGTGVVPDKEFTLLPGDVVNIEIDQLGKLTNIVSM